MPKQANTLDDQQQQLWDTFSKQEVQCESLGNNTKSTQCDIISISSESFTVSLEFRAGRLVKAEQQQLLK